MSKIDPKKLSKGRRDALAREVLNTFSLVGLTEEGKMLLRGMLTESEMVMLSRRIHIARLLILGDSFPKIAKDLHVGLTTIRCVHDWLDDMFDDYRSFLPPLLRRKNEQAILDASTLQSLRNRYPSYCSLLHVLLSDQKLHEIVNTL